MNAMGKEKIIEDTNGIPIPHIKAKFIRWCFFFVSKITIFCERKIALSIENTIENTIESMKSGNSKDKIPPKKNPTKNPKKKLFQKAGVKVKAKNSLFLTA